MPHPHTKMTNFNLKLGVHVPLVIRAPWLGAQARGQQTAVLAELVSTARCSAPPVAYCLLCLHLSHPLPPPATPPRWIFIPPSPSWPAYPTPAPSQAAPASTEPLSRRPWLSPPTPPCRWEQHHGTTPTRTITEKKSRRRTRASSNTNAQQHERAAARASSNE
jgi:hypothetical protein